MAIGEIGHFSRPVVHFRIDIGRVFALPGRFNQVIPNALQIGGQGPMAAGGDHQITSKLHIEGHKLWVCWVFPEFEDTIVRGKMVFISAFKMNRETVKERLVICDMPLLYRLVIEGGEFPQRRFDVPGRLPANILIVHKIGMRCQVDGCRCSPGNNDLLVPRQDLSVCGDF